MTTAKAPAPHRGPGPSTVGCQAATTLTVTFADTSGRIQRITKGGRQVRVHGEPSELTMWALGRKDAARVQMTGEAEAINVLNEARWRL